MPFIGRHWRKKRQVPLPHLRQLPESGSNSAMSWRPPVHHAAGIERNLYESWFRTHAACCGCGDIVGHFNRLVERYGTPPRPGAPGAPRPNIRALPAPENNPQAEPWRGGDAGEDGAAGAGGNVEADADYSPEDVEQLLAAAAADTQ